MASSKVRGQVYRLSTDALQEERVGSKCENLVSGTEYELVGYETLAFRLFLTSYFVVVSRSKVILNVPIVQR